MRVDDWGERIRGGLLAVIWLALAGGSGWAADPAGPSQGPPPVPVRLARAEKRTVATQITLIGTTEPAQRSVIAAEVPGVVDRYPVREGDYVPRGALLAGLKSIDLEIRLKGARAVRERIRANLDNAQNELQRLKRLKASDSIADRRYDEALYSHRALTHELLQGEAEIERLQYELVQKKVLAPFAGFVAREHAQVGQYIMAGGPVVTLLDLDPVRILVDVPERFAVMLASGETAYVTLQSVSSDPLEGRIYAVLPQGDAAARTFPVRIDLANPGHRIKSGMEARVTFNLDDRHEALLVPKDAVVTAGDSRLVFAVADGKAQPVTIQILGYYDGNVAVQGLLNAGDPVVIRGNERLRPGQPVVPVE